MTPSTNGRSARSTTAQARERSTTSTAPPETSTTKPYAPWVTASSASCTAAYATTPSIANTPPGHTTKPPKPLDSYEPGMSTLLSNSMSHPEAVNSGDAGCLTKYHLDLVSDSCHFFSAAGLNVLIGSTGPAC